MSTTATTSIPLGELLARAGLAPLPDGPDRSPLVTAVEHDSRACTPGCLYVAVRGGRHDGHDHAAEAVRAGAVAVVGERAPGELDTAGAPYVQVPASRPAMACLAHALHDFPARSMRVVAITGTNGKTSTAFFLRDLLASAGHRAGVLGTESDLGGGGAGSPRTTPEAPVVAAALAGMRDAGQHVAVVEASAQGLAMERLTGLDPEVGVFTNLAREHLEDLGTMPVYAEAKGRLFRDLRPDAIAIANADDAWMARVLRGCAAAVRTFGRGAGCDTRLVRERYDEQGAVLEVEIGGAWPEAVHGTLRLQTSLLGPLNADNILAALSAAIALGVDHEEIVRGVRALEPMPGRMQPVTLRSGTLALLDAAHSADGLERALDAARGLAEARGGEVGCVFRFAASRDRDDRPRVAAVAASRADWALATTLLTTGDEPAQRILADAERGIPPERRATVTSVEDWRAAVLAALERARPQDVLLLAAHDVGERLIRDGEPVEGTLLRLVSDWERGAV